MKLILIYPISIIVLLLGVSTPAPALALDVMSFNIQFLANFKAKRNDDLARIMEPYDLVLVQELVAPPSDGVYPDGEAYTADKEATAFFDAMSAVGFSWVLSPEDTGTGPAIHKKSSATEWWVAFFKPGALEIATDLPSGFLADDRSDHADYERVPYAFGFKVIGGSDMVIISTHLQPGKSSSDARRRAHEINAIADWIDRNESADPERDYIILGDMNIKDCGELAQVMPTGFVSLNDQCQPTNTSQNDPRPYDHVMYRPATSGDEIDAGSFLVMDLIEAARPLWPTGEPYPGDPYDHNAFRTRYSDHHPVTFEISVVPDDD